MNVLVLDSDVNQATTELIRSRLVHVVSVTDLEPWADQEGMERVPEEAPASLTEMGNAAWSIARRLGLGNEIISQSLAFDPFDANDARAKLAEINEEVRAVIATRDEARKKLADLQETRTQLPRDVWAKFGIDVRSRYTLLEMVTGRLLEKNLPALKRLLGEIPNVLLTFPQEKGTVAVMLVVLKKDRDALLKATEEVGLERVRAAEKKPILSDEMLSELEDHIREAEEALKVAEAAVKECTARHLPALRKILSQMTLQRLTGEAKRRFRKTARTYMISGWMPRSGREKVIAGLRNACGDRCLIEEQSAEEMLSEREGDVEVPILFENPRALKPFEMLVSSYGHPAYGSIDPTVVVTPTFLLMYGMMFGDAGQGLVLALLGALVAKWKKVSAGVRRIGQLFTWCGGSAVLFGLFYGSVFGLRNVLPYRGVEPLENVGSFLGVALFFGIGLMSMGMVFNVIAAITKKDWVTAMLDRTGLMGVAFYWLLVAAVAKFFSGKSLSGTVIGLILVLPVLGSFLKEPVKKLISPKRRAFEEGAASYVLKSLGESVATLFESLLMLLSNTMSFLRLAAFAVAHGALYIALFSIAEIVSGGGVGLPILVHILGNAGMIALEGLVVCVQALRLEYYEFFGKFFEVGKTEFSPMSLESTVP